MASHKNRTQFEASLKDALTHRLFRKRQSRRPVDHLDRFFDRRLAEVPVFAGIKLVQGSNEGLQVDVVVVVEMAEPPAAEMQIIQNNFHSQMINFDVAAVDDNSFCNCSRPDV